MKALRSALAVLYGLILGEYVIASVWSLWGCLPINM